MIQRGPGLIVEIGDGNTLDYRATLSYDLIKISVSLFALAMAEDLHKLRVAAVAITPGFMRTEAMLHFGVTEANWREGGEGSEFSGFRDAVLCRPCNLQRSPRAPRCSIKLVGAGVRVWVH